MSPRGRNAAEPARSVCLCSRGRVFGGIERFLTALAGWLARRGCRVTVASAEPDLYRERWAGDLPIVAVPLPSGDDCRLSPAALWRAWRFFRRVRPDGVLFNHARNYSFAASVLAARWAGARRVVSFHHGTIEVAASFPRARVFPPRALWAVRSRARFRVMARRTDAMLCNHAANAESIVRHFGVPPGKVHVEHLGADETRFAPDPAARRRTRRQLGIAEGTLAVGTLCRLDGQKGEDILIDAVSELARGGLDVRGVLIGDGPARAELEARAQAAGAAVRFAGFVDAPEAHLNALDVFVLASARESFGLALVEAMATALPCVAASVGGMRDILTDGRDGLLLASRDAADLTAKLRLLAGDPSLRARLGAAARETVLARFRQADFLARVGRHLGVPGDAPAEAKTCSPTEAGPK